MSRLDHKIDKWRLEEQEAPTMQDLGVESHYEKVKCPNCGSLQVAEVVESLPWYAYIHECDQCHYMIMESEWEVAGDVNIYVAGKITGLQYDEAKQGFINAASELSKMSGYSTIIPFENGLPPESDWLTHMKADLKLLLDCDAIYLLNNWKDSKGARIERELADKLGYVIIEQE